MSVAGRNSPVSNYTVVYWKTVGGRNNASNIAMVSVNTSQSDKSLEVELTDLMSDTAYSIEIAGVSEPEGPGEYSEPVTFKMPVELKGELSLCNDFMYNVVEAHCYALQSKRIDCEQIRSRINQQLIAGRFGHEGLRQLRTKQFCMQLTKAFVAETSCN